MRNFAGVQAGATGFEAEAFEGAGFGATAFAVWRFAEAAGFVEVVRLGEAAGFGGAARLGDWACFDEPLKTSDSQPASLASIGSNTDATIAAMMMRRRGQTPKPERVNFLPDDSNRY